MNKQELKDLFSASLDLEMALFKISLAIEEVEERETLRDLCKWSQLITQVKNEVKEATHEK